MQEEEGQKSSECIQASQIFPKKSPVLEEENMQVKEVFGTPGQVYPGQSEDLKPVAHCFLLAK